MRGKGQHDQVGVQAVEAVARVGVVLREHLLSADVFHNLVLTFTGNLWFTTDGAIGLGDAVSG